MPALIVLFNLRPGVSPDEYERWARETDVPTVTELRSVEAFRVLRLERLLFGDGRAPYAYCEVIDVTDLDLLGEEIASARVQEIAAEFQAFADEPVFVVAQQVA